jgi:hypothetical protein
MQHMRLAFGPLEGRRNGNVTLGHWLFSQGAAYVASMEIQVTLKKDRKIIAREFISEPKVGDLTIVIGKLFASARKLLDGPVWDCQIDVRRLR